MPGEFFHSYKFPKSTKKIKRLLIWSFVLIFLLILFQASVFAPKDPIQGITCGGVADLKCPTGYQCKLKSTAPKALGTCRKQLM